MFRKTGLHVLFVFLLILTLSFTIPHSSCSGSNVPSIEWDRPYGGSGTTAYSVVQTSDGGYALAGSLGSYGAGLVKFSPDLSAGSLGNSSFSVDSWLIITIVAVVVIGAVVGGAIYYFRKRKPSIPPPPPQT